MELAFFGHDHLPKANNQHQYSAENVNEFRYQMNEVHVWDLYKTNAFSTHHLLETSEYDNSLREALNSNEILI